MLRLRFDALEKMVPTDHPDHDTLRGWLRALQGQAHLVLMVYNLLRMLQEATGYDVRAHLADCRGIVETLRRTAGEAEAVAIDGN